MGIDTHVHGRGRKQETKTTPSQCIREGWNAGIGTNIFQPNTNFPITTLSEAISYKFEIEEGRKRNSVPFTQYLYFGATDSNHKEAEKAYKFHEIVGPKGYPPRVTTGDVYISKNSAIKDHMRIASDFGKVFPWHCDDERHTIAAEVSCAKRILDDASAFPELKVILCHISNAQTLEVALQAQSSGMQVGVEFAPQYYMFDSDRSNWIPGLDPVFYHFYNNPRPKRIRMELRCAMAQAIKDENPFIFGGSDSACHASYEKLANPRLGGIPSNQELIPVLVQMAQEFGITSKQLANVICYNPSNFFNISVDRKLVSFIVEEMADDKTYNNGLVVNPWKGLILPFLKPVTIMGGILTLNGLDPKNIICFSENGLEEASLILPDTSLEYL